MDDERNKTLFRNISDDCTWKSGKKLFGRFLNKCSASSLACCQENCTPFKFALFFNRPEIKNN